MMSKNAIGIGIDLGTTNTSVGISIRGRVEIVQNENGQRTTPSCIAFKDKDPLIGTTAVDQVNSNMKNTIFGIKKFLGRTFDDYMRNNLENRLFKIVEGDDKLPKVEIQWGSDKKRFSPEEISSLIINRMKEITETHIGSTYSKSPATVESVVIAVPQYFGSSQRQATKDAAVVAGFAEANVHLIPEPVAAAIAYNTMTRQTNHYRSEKCNLLVIDIGGGKCETSIVTIHGSNIEGKEKYILKLTDGMEILGGDSIDEILESIAEKIFDVEFSENDTHELRSALRTAKEKLSMVDFCKSDVHLGGKDFTLSMERKLLEQRCISYFEELKKAVTAIIDAAKAEQEQIHDYILIGGTTRMPKIRALIKELLRGREPNQTINPDEAVAYGAAIYAESVQESRKLFVESKLSKPLWIKTSSGYATDLPPQHSKLLPYQVASAVDSQPTSDKYLETIHLEIGPPNIELTVNTFMDGTQQFFATDKLTEQKFTLTSTTLQGLVDKDGAKQRIKDRQFTAEVDKMRGHICELITEQFVTEQQLKMFESTIEKACNTTRQKKMEKITSTYESIIRTAQEYDEYKLRNWRTHICFAENDVLPTVKDLFFDRDSNSTLIFQVHRRIDDTHEVVEVVGELPPTFGTSTMPLKFAFGENGILNMDVSNKLFRTKGIITERVGCLRKEEIHKMVAEQRNYRGYIAVKKALEACLYNTSDKVKEWMRNEKTTKDHRSLFTAHREAQTLVTSSSNRLQMPSDYTAMTAEMSKEIESLEKLFDTVVVLEEERSRKQSRGDHKKEKTYNTRGAVQKQLRAGDDDDSGGHTKPIDEFPHEEPHKKEKNDDPEPKQASRGSVYDYIPAYFKKQGGY